MNLTSLKLSDLIETTNLEDQLNRLSQTLTDRVVDIYMADTTQNLNLEHMNPSHRT